MKKVTFTFDDETVETIRRAAKREDRPQSAVVREAVAMYGAREDRLSEAERQRLLNVLDAHLALMPKRSAAAVDRELREIRASRRAGWRRRSERRRR